MTTARTVAEWIGKTPDSAIPPRVRLRVFERFDGICQLTQCKIRPGDKWECDHIKPLKDGGEHRESNLQPVLRSAHRKKTAEENKARAKVTRMRKKHLGIENKGKPMPGTRASEWKHTMAGKWVKR